MGRAAVHGDIAKFGGLNRSTENLSLQWRMHLTGSSCVVTAGGGQVTTEIIAEFSKFIHALSPYLRLCIIFVCNKTSSLTEIQTAGVLCVRMTVNFMFTARHSLKHVCTDAHVEV